MRAEMDNFDPTIGDIENTMRKREKQIVTTKDKMNTVEDSLLWLLQEYWSQEHQAAWREGAEELAGKGQEEAWVWKPDKQDQHPAGVWAEERGAAPAESQEVWEKCSGRGGSELEASNKAESVTMTEIDKEMKEVEKLKSEKTFLESEVDKVESEVEDAKKEGANVLKDMASIIKQINQIEVGCVV